MTTDPFPPTHDWHVDPHGQELLIVRDEVDSVGVYLGPEGIDIAREDTKIITSRLLEMIDTVQPGAVRAYLAAQEPTDAEVLAALNADYALRYGPSNRPADSLEPYGDEHVQIMRAALSAARADRRDEENR